MEISQINAALNLAFPIKWSERIVEKDGKKDLVAEPLIWAYHTAVSREIFEANYNIISMAHMELFSKGIGFAAESGPIIAALALREAAKQRAIEIGEPKVDLAAPLMAQLKVLTMVLAPGQAGYEYVPVDIALQHKIIDDDDWREAESAIVFFTCGLWMARRTMRTARREALAFILRGSITSLQPTEFIASLPTLTPAATSATPPPTPIAETETPVSSIPS